MVCYEPALSLFICSSPLISLQKFFGIHADKHAGQTHTLRTFSPLNLLRQFIFHNKHFECSLSILLTGWHNKPTQIYDMAMNIRNNIYELNDCIKFQLGIGSSSSEVCQQKKSTAFQQIANWVSIVFLPIA